MDEPTLGAYYFLLTQKVKNGKRQYTQHSFRYTGRDLGKNYVFVANYGLFRIAPRWIKDAELKLDQDKPQNLTGLKT